MLSLGNSLKAVANTCLRFIYPRSCLHCGSGEMMDNRFCCNRCLEYLQPLTYGEVVSDHRLYNAIGAAFDYQGVAKSLVRAMKCRDMPYLAPVAAAYLLFQLVSLEWPWPELIVPVPQSSYRRISRGYNSSSLIAQALSKMIDVPCKPILKRRLGGFYQEATLRGELNDGLFLIKRGEELKGKKILVVDDLVATGATLNSCAVKLIDCRPAALHALAVCRTNKVL